MTVESIPVESSLIKSAAYDWSAHTLSVVLRTGGEYVTPNVTPAEIESFKSAPSQGKWWLANVRGRAR